MAARSTRRATGALTVAALLVLLLMAGCKESSRQTTVVTTPPSAEETATITPIERGRIRTEALRAVRAGIAAWLEDDLETMRPNLSDGQFTYFETQKAGYDAENKARVRVHTEATMDVVDMSADGREVSVSYVFTDDSYFVSSSGAQLSEPAGTKTEMTISVVKVENSWVIVRMIAGKEQLQ